MSNELIKVISPDSECIGCYYATKEGNQTEACKTIDCEDDNNYYHFVYNVNKIDTDNVKLTKEAQRLRKDLR